MPSLETPEHPLVATLKRAFAGLVERGLVDVVRIDDQVVELQSDEWTLHLEGWPVTIGWIALDETPVSANEQLIALDAALSSGDRAALREANTLLDGKIVDSLAGSGDPLSAALADLLGDAADPEPDGDVTESDA